MTLWPELRSLPRIANTLLDLVRLSQEQSLLLRELIEARSGRPARTRRAHPRTARQPPLGETSPASGPPSSSPRPPATGDRVWRQTREKIEERLAEQEDRRLHPHRYLNLDVGKYSPLPPGQPLRRHLDANEASAPATPTPPTRSSPHSTS